ncbi:MAG: hypothetical protein ACR2FN_02850 [Chitinophagaceae bacterium]
MKKNIMNAMMLSCVKATELMEMKEHVPLGLVKTMQLHMHTAMCSGCKNYMKQSLLINALLNKNFNMFYSDENTDKLEASIISKL